jgi:hypothetical protein
MNGETQQPPIHTISVIDPISQAIDRTRDVLFRPFSIDKWLILGFCAWLAQLGQGGGGPSGQGSSDDPHQIRHEFHHAWAWVMDHLVPIVVIGFVVVVFIVVIWLMFLWLSSRGKFMFLDGVVNNRGAVVEPWHRFRSHANSLFLFRFSVGLVSGVFMLGLVFAMLTTIWFWAEMRIAEPMFILGMVAIILGILCIAIILGLIGLAIDDFLVPLMYLRDCKVGPAWRELSALLGARPGAFVLYVLIRFIISIVVLLIAMTICCLTCCIVLLPYLGTVITLPLWVFKRCYPLYFLGQFGPDFGPLAPADQSGGASSAATAR